MRHELSERAGIALLAEYHAAEGYLETMHVFDQETGNDGDWVLRGTPAKPFVENIKIEEAS
jgi:hypothetical protein